MDLPSAPAFDRRPVAVWLAGSIGLDDYSRMAEQLAWEVSEPEGRPPTLLLFDMAPSITIGRLGSRADVDLSDDELRSRGLEVRFVGRGGGAVLHGPGQIGISLFAPLEELGLRRHAVGGLLERFESGLEAAVRSLRCGTARDSGVHGIFGRTGLLASVGCAVRRGVVRHGGFLNVLAGAELHRRVKSVPVALGGGMRTMGSVEADVQRRVRLQDARAALVEHLVDAFDFPRAHIQSGFPIPAGRGRPGPAEHVRRV